MTQFETPDQIYGELFERVQLERVFADSKSFVDAIPRSSPREILRLFGNESKCHSFDLKSFVQTHFELPKTNGSVLQIESDISIENHIDSLWDALTRPADESVEYSSLIPLPNPYVVPGGRFREVYYWDTYFTMLGLATSGRIDLVRGMVENFASLISTLGFIPNGNRTYYCSRSQPPYFSLMVELLADISNDESCITQYLPHMEREYRFWMDGLDAVSEENPTHRRVVWTRRGVLNRYWGDQPIPRQESYMEDMELAAQSTRTAAELYRDIRAGAESGWDFGSRWFLDGSTRSAIRTTEILPIDLNSLIYKLEMTLAKGYELDNNSEKESKYRELANKRRSAIRECFFDADEGMFVDLKIDGFVPTGNLSIAATYPLFLEIATDEQAAAVVATVQTRYLRSGGWVTSQTKTAEQWDYPNGWAPMQWVTFSGFKRYGYEKEAMEGARNWVLNNLTVYGKLGRLLEKYNVNECILAGGGEYENQDGFGWTNAILQLLIQHFPDLPSNVSKSQKAASA